MAFANLLASLLFSHPPSPFLVTIGTRAIVAPTVDRGLDYESNVRPGSIVWHAMGDGAKCSKVQKVQTVLRLCRATGRGPATYCRSHGWVTLNYDPVRLSQP